MGKKLCNLRGTHGLKLMDSYDLSVVWYLGRKMEQYIWSRTGMENKIQETIMNLEVIVKFELIGNAFKPGKLLHWSQLSCTLKQSHRFFAFYDVYDRELNCTKCGRLQTRVQLKRLELIVARTEPCIQF